MLTLILVEPESSGNIGAVARVMKNFGFSELVLINPKAEINDECFQRAKHAKEIVLKAKKTIKSDISILKNYDITAGTSAKKGTDYNLVRSFLSIEDAVKLLKKYKNPALVFGREGKGLSNDELKMCDIVINIPTKEYSAMNLSHAVAVMLYVFNKSKEKIQELAGNKEKAKLLELINELIDKHDFRTKEKKETQRVLWKRILGKTAITRRELQALFGFFKKFK